MLYVIIFSVTSLAWFFHGFTGFGAAVLVTAILPIIMETKIVIVSGAVPNLFGTLFLSLKIFDKRAEFRILIPLLSSALLGIWLGSYFLGIISSDILKAILGCFLFILGIYDYLVQKGILVNIALPKGNFVALVVGAIAGFITGLLGTGGPLIVIYLNQIIKDKNDFKLLLSLIFFIQISTRILFYIINPNVRQYFDLFFIIVAIPPVFFATFIGHKLTEHVRTDTFKMIISISIIILGLYMLFETVIYNL